MGAVVQLTADDGHVLNAYRAAPDGEPRAGLVLVQEIFGVNGHIRGVCDDYAAQGYLVLAPCLFDRKEPGIELGYSAETVDEGRGHKADIGWEGPVMDIKAGVDALEGAPKVVVVGYCWGGSLAWLAACRPGDRRGGRLLRRPDHRVRGRDTGLPDDAPLRHRRRGHPDGRRGRDHDDPPGRHGSRLSGRRPRLQLRPAGRLSSGGRHARPRPIPSPTSHAIWASARAVADQTFPVRLGVVGGSGLYEIEGTERG